MMFRSHLIRGLSHPDIYSYQLKKAEEAEGVWKRAVLLILASGLIFGLSAYFGIGSEYLSRKLTELSGSEFEMHKVLYVIGQLLWGLFYGAAIIFLPALFFWTLSDLELKKLIVVQLLVLLILLAEKLIMIPVNLALGLPDESSPFSLGVLAQTFTSNGFIVSFLASITIFKAWAIWIQIKYLKDLTEKSMKVVVAMVVGLNVALWLLGALFSIIQFEKII
ncbi:hypothetical protein [Bacillus sp. T33-2]|uniref:hypothetical protein n=1 Tax=Bacillus sp. T33-2 TaxID=2054168 RepID=UPI000C76F028|nr:hypothetical protein [Bacillus sp. T33-2]PLR94477.1 hypothetical protein CVD19_17475 [Bacillus sp. T33-2]